MGRIFFVCFIYLAMPKNQVDAALKDFSLWLRTNQWRGKEHDCVNMFAHKFLYNKITPDSAIYSLMQIRIECGLKQPGNDKYLKKSARKDLVIWGEPEQNSWSETWEPVNIPIVVMEWKAKFKPAHKGMINSHDTEWVRLYTEENPNCIGFVVLVDLTTDPRKIYWRSSKRGKLSKQICI